MKRSILLLLFLFLLSSGVNAQVRIAGSPGEGYALTVDGEKVFIKGTCGRVTLEDAFGRATMGEAARRGANAYRTYSSDSTTVARAVEAASRHGMYLMMGISLPKNPARYRDEAFRQKMREQCTALAERYADDRNIIVWALGNELNMGEGIGEEGWRFVEELAVLMKERDSRHLTCTVLSSARAAGIVGRLCPSLDFVGINSYGGIGGVERTLREEGYDGAYMITEWGPTGWWERPKTSWGAPVEQTSSQKCTVIERRYRQCILEPKACMGSFVFLWGQKEERTPTWFGLFVESGVEGLPLDGQPTPAVEVMERLWKQTDAPAVAPVVLSITAGGKPAVQNPVFAPGEKFEVSVGVESGRGTRYVWEILREATRTATGGAYEPRPERYGNTCVTRRPVLKTRIDSVGNYRVYCYAISAEGYAATANIPVSVGR